MASFDRAEAMRVGETCVCRNARKFARVLTNAFDEALLPTDLRLTQSSLLTHLRALGRATVTDLTSARDLDQTTVSRNVNVLFERDCSLTSVRAARVITLTTAGQAALDRAYPLWASHQAALVAKLGGEAGWAVLRGDLVRLSGGI
jgi:DNA-binding MarR family transcriptional regulator